MFNNDNVVNIRVVGNRISDIAVRDFSQDADDLQLDLNNAFAFPGLINSHDHLDFNLFPKLGNRTYNNYTEWGHYIHKNYKNNIDNILCIPASLRAEWGVYKNLLAGVTTVVNHGEKITVDNPLITIFQACYPLHSARFEKYWKLKLNDPFKTKLPYAMHVGEGIDESSFQEIDEIIRWNFLNKNLFGIHGVAMNTTQAKKFKALIWCPQSNFFLLNKTANINELKQNTQILFGTDSTLTSCWNIWEHLREARKMNQLNDQELFNSLTENAARSWKLNNGKIEAGFDADIVIAKAGINLKGWESFYRLNPENLLLVIHQGQIRLFDDELYGKLLAQDFSPDGFSKIKVGNSHKYVEGNIPQLIKDIRKYSADANFPVNNSN